VLRCKRRLRQECLSFQVATTVGGFAARRVRPWAINPVRSSVRAARSRLWWDDARKQVAKSSGYCLDVNAFFHWDSGTVVQRERSVRHAEV
jgi:hypothetical protein